MQFTFTLSYLSVLLISLAHSQTAVTGSYLIQNDTNIETKPISSEKISTDSAVMNSAHLNFPSNSADAEPAPLTSIMPGEQSESSISNSDKSGDNAVETHSAGESIEHSASQPAETPISSPVVTDIGAQLALDSNAEPIVESAAEPHAPAFLERTGDSSSQNIESAADASSVLNTPSALTPEETDTKSVLGKSQNILRGPTFPTLSDAAKLTFGGVLGGLAANQYRISELKSVNSEWKKDVSELEKIEEKRAEKAAREQIIEKRATFRERSKVNQLTRQLDYANNELDELRVFSNEGYAIGKENKRLVDEVANQQDLLDAANQQIVDLREELGTQRRKAGENEIEIRSECNERAIKAQKKIEFWKSQAFTQRRSNKKKSNKKAFFDAPQQTEDSMSWF